MILMIITTAVPSTAAGIVSGTVGLALTHAFEAMYIANKIVNPMLNGIRAIGSNAIRAFGGNDGSLEARLRANERIAPPKPPEDPAKAPSWSAELRQPGRSKRWNASYRPQADKTHGQQWTAKRHKRHDPDRLQWKWERNNQLRSGQHQRHH